MSLGIKFIFDPNGNDMIFLQTSDSCLILWEKEWVSAFSQMEISDFESYYRNTIRPTLDDEKKAILDSIDRTEIPLAFDHLRNYFWRQ
jgi:hypothetical protein